jgi:hypothetical protein
MAAGRMPKFEKSSESVVQLFNRMTHDSPGERRTMFGYPALFLNGNMVTGTFGPQIIFRFDPSSHELLKMKYRAVRDFSPMPGKVSKGSLAVQAIESNQNILQDLLTQALSYAHSLPPKKSAK